MSLYVNLVSTNYNGLFGKLPDIETLQNPQTEFASELYSADSVLLGKYFRHNRTELELHEIPSNFINTLKATEDIRFIEHSGIDFKATFAIIWYLINNDNRGSSTITQQLAKNLFKTRSKLYEGSLWKYPIIPKVVIKTKEWITAIRIERAYTKDEILTLYTNTVDFGSNSFGLKVASQTFFGKKPDSLTIEECAMLVGLLKAPTKYSPVLNPENALIRRNTVLSQLSKYNFLTISEKDSLSSLPIVLDYKVENHNQGIATYFRSEMQKFLHKWTKERGIDLYNDGIKVYTTINSQIQKYAEYAVDSHMAFIQRKFYEHWGEKEPWIDNNGKVIKDFIENVTKRTPVYRALRRKYGEQEDSIRYYLNLKKDMRVFSWKGDLDTTFSSIDSIIYYKKILNCGLISIEPSTGHIRAWVGGINHKYFKFDHVYQMTRQPGSTFKPFVYATALDNGFNPCDLAQDIPVSFQVMVEEETMTWSPKNAENEYSYDFMTLRQAMARSVNSITASVMKKIGPERVVDYAQRLGITSELQPVPSLCLGANEVNLFDMSGAYSVFANNGVWTKPTYITHIEDRFGNVIERFVPEKREAISEETAHKMLYMLMGGVQEKGGTSQGLFKYNIKPWKTNHVGGKTGTTSNYSDGWYMGVTPDLITGVWVGGDERAIHFNSFEYGQGAKLALPIFALMMEQAYEDSTTSVRRREFDLPKGFLDQFSCTRFDPSDTTRLPRIQSDYTRDSIPKNLEPDENTIINPNEEGDINNLF